MSKDVEGDITTEVRGRKNTKNCAESVFTRILLLPWCTKSIVHGSFGLDIFFYATDLKNTMMLLFSRRV